MLAPLFISKNMNNVQLHSVNGPVFRYEADEKNAYKSLIDEQVSSLLGLSWQGMTSECSFCRSRAPHARYFANISNSPGIVGQWVNVCEHDVVIPVVIGLQANGRLHIRRGGQQILST